MDATRTKLEERTLPLVHLGSCRKGLTEIFAAVNHAVWLDYALTVKDFTDTVREFVIGTFDLGTEFHLNDVESVPVREIIHGISERVLRPQAPAPELVITERNDDFADPDPEPAPDPTISSHGMLRAPGLLHVLHNAGTHVLENAKVLPSVVDKLGAVMKLMINKDTRDRVLET